MKVLVIMFASIGLMSTLGPKFHAEEMIESVALKFTVLRVISLHTMVSSLIALERGALNGGQEVNLGRWGGP